MSLWKKQHEPGPVSKSRDDITHPDFFENRALDLAYENVICQEFSTRAEIYLTKWVEEAKVGFKHKGLIRFLIEQSEKLIAESEEKRK